MYSPIKPSRLYKQIVEQIEKLILEGVLDTGSKLPSERELGEQFGVSRTVIREAIKALHEKGLVIVQPGRGTFITGDSSTAMRHSLDMMVKYSQDGGLEDLFLIRNILEPEIAAIAAVKATQDDIQRLEQALQTMDETLDDGEKFIEADQQFHYQLAVATQNTFIPVLINAFVDYLQKQRSRIFDVEGGPARGQQHHRNILKAVSERDPDGARNAMRAHMKQIREDIM